MKGKAASPPSKLVAWCQLTRVGLVCSAPSNVLLGAFLAMGTSPWPLIPTLLLCLASCFLYLSGMALNDWCDRITDAHERPSRPIPSGRISANAAWLGGCILMSLGLICAGLTSLLLWCPLAVSAAILLALLIWLYNAVTKNGPLGPWVMGACRGVNVLLGASLSTNLPGTDALLGAASVALVIWGITTMARHETSVVPLAAIRLGTGSFAVPFLVMTYWIGRDPNPASPWSALLAFWLATKIGHLLKELSSQPNSPQVPRIIGGFLGLLIPMDALLASAVVGFAGFSLLGLWIIAIQFRRFRWLYAS